MGTLWTTLLVFTACTLVVLAVRPGALRRSLALPQLVWVMLASGLTNVCFNVALATGDVVRSVLLFYLMPMWVVVLARWLLPEPEMDTRRPSKPSCARCSISCAKYTVP